MLVATTALTFSLAHAQESLQTLNFKDGRIAQNLRGQKVSASVDGNMLVKALGLADGNTFNVVKTTTDKLNVTHTNFQQYYKGILVNGAVIMVHAKDGLVQSINGHYLEVNGLSVNVTLDDTKATSIAQNAIGIKTVTRNYAPELQVVKSESGEPVMTYAIRVDGKNEKGIFLMKRAYLDAQSGEVYDLEELIAHTDVTGTAHTFHSGARTITMDYDGVSTYRLYDNARKIRTMDATNQDISYSSISFYPNAKEITNNSTEWLPKKAVKSTRLSVATNNIFSGINFSAGILPVAIVGTEGANGDIEDPSFPQVLYSNSAPLRAEGWFHYVEPGVNYVGAFAKANLGSGNVTDTIRFPINADTMGNILWSDSQGNSGRYVIDSMANPALDAHWGIARTFDYYHDKFSRNSYDNQGGRIINYINGVFPMMGSQNNAAALQDPYNVMVYGLGDGINTNPFSALDVTGHEYTHLVISNNGNGGLRYSGESGALNESFADMFGASIVFYAKPEIANWRIGDEVYIGNGYMRSMSNPKTVSNPNTYQGQYWVSTSSNQDNGGVHNNSSVPNYWYYLLAEGGSGTNDNGYSYNFTGVGLENAEKIAYRTLTEYLTYNASFEDAFSGSLQAVIDLFGADTTGAAYVAVKNAWYAVGLGEGGNTVSVKDITLTNPDIDIYPNPVAANASFTILSKLDKAIAATVFNGLGQAVKLVTIKNGSNSINVGGLAAGVYNISFNVAGKQYVHKLTVL
ncbi:MAG: T9SS type A sorting domain-containing protein [Sphingobacteriales bacterium]|nr:MAG: T9SS type A sorting domain-containing protein [Sphingobacteriales bacterium]